MMDIDEEQYNSPPELEEVAFLKNTELFYQLAAMELSGQKGRLRGRQKGLAEPLCILASVAETSRAYALESFGIEKHFRACCAAFKRFLS